MFKAFIILFFLVVPAFAGLPPTSTKGSGDANPVTTFQINTPNIPISHSGVIATIGTIPVAGGGTGITSGTSGGIPYFSSTSTIASSGLLTANQLILGGGAGATPASLGSLGTTTTLLHGNAGGAPTFGAVSLTADVSGTLPVGNGGTGTATSFTQGSAIFAGASGVYSQDNANYFWDATNHSLGLGNAAPGATYRLNITGPEVITSNISTALVVGPNGATNPVLQIDGSTASSVTGLLITGTATGSGTSLTAISSGTNEGITINSKGNGSVVLNNPSTTGIISLRTSSNARFAVSGANFNYTPSTLSTAATVRMSYVGAADTAMTTAVEAPNWYINLGQTRQHAQGSITTQRDFRFTPSTHSFATGASTITDAMGMSIDGPPSGGTNATLTTVHSLYIGSAATANAGTSYGLTVNASSGATKNYAAQFQGGSVIISNNGTALTTAATDGFQYISSTNGAPAGTPTTQAGASPITVDTSNNNFYYYSGGAWRLPTTTSSMTVTSQSTNYSAAINDLVLATAALTVTLPTAVGNSGKSIAIINTSATAVNVTINTTSSQTIGARASGDIILRRQNNYLSVTSDGSNWIIRGKNEHQVITAAAGQVLAGITGSYQNGSPFVTLGIGEWDLTGMVAWNYGAGSTNSAVTYLTGFYAANGADNTSAPTALAAGVVDGPTSYNDVTGGGAYNPIPNQSATGNIMITPLTTRIIVTSGTQNVYFVPNAQYTVAGTQSFIAYINAKRIY